MGGPSWGEAREPASFPKHGLSDGRKSPAVETVIPGDKQPHPGPLCLRLSRKGLRAEGSAGLPSRAPSLPRVPAIPPRGGDRGFDVPSRRTGMKQVWSKAVGARGSHRLTLRLLELGPGGVTCLPAETVPVPPPSPSLLRASPSQLGTPRIPSMSPSWPADPRGPGSLLLCRPWEQRGAC